MRRLSLAIITALAGATVLLPGMGLAAPAHRVPSARFVSRICPYSIKVPGGWKVKPGGSYDDISNGKVHAQVSCEKATGAVSGGAFTHLFVKELKKRGAVVLSVQTKGDEGFLKGYYPRKLFGKVVWFETAILKAMAHYFQIQFLAFSKATLHQYRGTIQALLNSLS